mmetsp:Transcript_3370/g.7727  ORF Transcript_3370/g.7727 Transcript_3370/m.7727 type:complete len:245 (+) Transcript_3370:104-838(+)
MTLLEQYNKSSKDKATKILDGAIAKLQGMEATFATCFPHATLSSASAEFKKLNVESGSNEPVSKAVSMTIDEISAVSQDVRALEVFLNLHIPKMEDGNNFGVSVQLSMLKQLSEIQEAAGKAIDELSGYSNARAESLSKLNLPSVSSSVTKSTSSSTTDGKKEEKSSESKEEKKSSSDMTGPTFESRVAALIATDTQYYSKAQRAFQATMSTYMAVLDFMDKNKEKLEKPKGSGGSHSGYQSMY